MKLKYKLLAVFLIESSFIANTQGQGIWATDTTSGFVANAYHSTGVVNDKIYLIGGYTDTFQVFDPSAHTCSTPVTLGTYSRREFETAGLVDDNIYVSGGQLRPTQAT